MIAIIFEDEPAEGTVEEQPDKDEESAGDEDVVEEADEEPVEEPKPRRPPGRPG